MLNTSTSSSHWCSRPAWLEHSQPPWAPWHCDWAVSHVSEHLVRPSSQGIPWILLILWLMIWLVVYHGIPIYIYLYLYLYIYNTPLWKMMEFVSWDDEIYEFPDICSKHFQTTNQWIRLINSIVLNDVLLISMASIYGMFHGFCWSVFTENNAGVSGRCSLQRGFGDWGLIWCDPGLLISWSLFRVMKFLLATP